jgi:type IV pilus assembly protein PilN
MRVTINLASRPYADHGPAIKQLRIAMGVLAALCLGLGLGLMHFHQAALNMAAKEEQVDRRVQQVEREQAGYRQKMQEPANARVLQQAQFLNSLFDEKSFSWTGAMEDLEQVLPAGVQVTAIEPSRGKDGRITLHLRVTGQREQAVAMLRNMEHSRRFTTPRISGENAENNSQGGLQPVRDPGPPKVNFDVLAEYNPATLAERKAATEGMRKTHPKAGLPHGAHEPGSAVRQRHPITHEPRPQVPRTRRPASGTGAPTPQGNRQ